MFLTCVGLVLRHVPQKLSPTVVLLPFFLRHVWVRVLNRTVQALQGHLVQYVGGRAANTAQLAQGFIRQAVAAAPAHVPVTNHGPVQHDKDGDGHLHQEVVGADS